jgi:N-acyl-D-amino-acid deacylase
MTLVISQAGEAAEVRDPAIRRRGENPQNKQPYEVTEYQMRRGKMAEVLYDLIIRNGTVIDGSGADAVKADIGVVGDRIETIGSLDGAKAKAEIDAAGKYVTPGFIDPHCHADLTALIIPTMEAYLMQGVTTVVGGNCGHSMAPMGDSVYRSAIVDFPVTAKAAPSFFNTTTLMVSRDKAAAAIKELYGFDLDWHTLDEYIDKCNEKGLDCNVVPLAGYSAIRTAVMGDDCMREATAEELTLLEASVRECMEAGAFGFSTGLDPQYVPGLFATDEETVRMLRVVKEYDGIFASHTFNARMDGTGGRMDGYRCMLDQAMAAGVRANVSHVHVLGMAATPEEGAKAAQETLRYFEEVEAAGLDLSYDVIPSPYSAEMTIPYFSFFLKPFMLMLGSRRRLAESFTVPDFRLMVHKVIEAGLYPFLDESQGMNLLSMLTVLKHTDASCVGKTFTAIAEERGEASALDVMMDLFAADCDMSANISLSGFADAVDILAKHRMAMPCSDGMGCAKDTDYTGNPEMPTLPNAMNLSFIPRFILEYGKPRLEDTIRQISGFAAERFGIADRGLLAVGNFADIVVLDLANLQSHDMDDDCLQYPEGIDHVIVNGVRVIEKKQRLSGGRGKMLRKPRG